MKKYFAIIAVLLSTIIFSCYKDKGNYDLTPINEIKPSAEVRDTIKVFQYDTLKIEGKTDQSIPVTDENLNFKWSVFSYAGITNVKADLGTNRLLNTPIGVPPGKYTLLFTVTDKATEVSYFKTFYMEVSSTLSEGWLVLENRAGNQQDVAIINPNGNVLHSLYSTANAGESLPAGSNKIRVLNNYLSEQKVFILSDKDGVEVDYTSFRKFEFFKSWFFATVDPVRIDNYFYNKLGTAGFFVNNGDLYSQPFTYPGPRKFGAPIGGDHLISKFAFPMLSSEDAIFFDDKNQRFLRHGGGQLRTYANPAGSAFDMNNVGKKLVFGGVGIGDYFNCLFKNNNDDQFYVYRVNSTGAIPAAETFTVDEAPELVNAQFYASSGQFLHLYYALENRIYLLDIPAKKARLVYTLPADEIITAFKLKQAQGLLQFYPDNNRQICVATYNNAEGKVYYFPISNTGDFEGNTFSHVFKGFGKVNALEYKNRK